MRSLDRPISPPRKRRADTDEASQPPAKRKPAVENPQQLEAKEDDGIRVIRSPIRLYAIKDLPDSENVDAITLKDIFSSPSTLDEIWSFNFMTNMSFIRGFLGPEDERRVKVHIVHGYWRQGDESRKAMEAGVWGNNVKLISAYVPDVYGTHHSKIIVIFRTDDTAQVIVHTGNMIPFDHENMANAYYITDSLPLKSEDTPQTEFQAAICNYFAFYSPSRTGRLVSRLKKHDFTSVRAHFIGSVPGKFEGEKANQWGLGRLDILLKDVETHPNTEIFAQFSSIGSLGKNDTWLGPQFLKTLAISKSSHPIPKLRLIYPTLKSIQESLNGYRSGTSIHWTINSAAHEAQESYMRPLLRKWHSLEAGRERAAPHIKTYGRVSANSTFDWFLLTSANLSKPAWGAHEGKPPHQGLRLRSYEAGVLFFPALWGEGTVLVPVYKSDFPSEEQIHWAKEGGYKTIVGIRMAWDLPLKKYGDKDVAWVRNRSYEEPDWLGTIW